MGPGPLIAIDVILLYTILGPVVLFAVYVFFDTLEGLVAQGRDEGKSKKDPALWTREEFDDHGRDLD